MDPLYVTLTPIPAGIRKQDGKQFLDVNVFVSFQADRATTLGDTKKINLDYARLLSSDFPDFITSVINNSTVFVESSPSMKRQLSIIKSTQEIVTIWNTIFPKPKIYSTPAKTLPNPLNSQKAKIQNANIEANRAINDLNEQLIVSKNKVIELNNDLALINQLTSDKALAKEINTLITALNKVLKNSKGLDQKVLKGIGNDLAAFQKRTNGNLSAATNALKKAIAARDAIQNKLKNWQGFKKNINEGPIVPVPNGSSQDTENRLKYVPKPTPAELSFTDVVGYLTHYPALMKQAGLIHTFSVELNSPIHAEQGIVTLNLPIDDKIKNLSSFKLLRTKDQIPLSIANRVCYELVPPSQSNDPILFIPQARPKLPTDDEETDKFVKGLLKIDKKKSNKTSLYTLTQINPYETAYRDPKYKDQNQSQNTTNGIHLVWNASDKTYIKKYSPDKKAPSNDPLYLEDLLIGYRIDLKRTVGSQQGSWHSLHQRTWQLRLGRETGPKLFSDEGWIVPDTLVEVHELIPLRDGGYLNIFAPYPTDPTDVVLTSGETVRFGKNNIQIGSVLVTNGTDRLDQDQKSRRNWIDRFNSQNFIIDGKTVQVAEDGDGDVFYEQIKQNPDGKNVDISAPKLMPTRIMCSITGHSLSAPTELNPDIAKKLTDLKTRVQTYELRLQPPISPPDDIHIYLAEKAGIMNVMPQMGSLPVLRIDDTYQVRCRAVTLDGSSVPLTLSGDDSSLQTTYFRREQVQAPLLRRLSNNQSSFQQTVALQTDELLVIRSDNGQGVTTSQRQILPPAISWQLAEWLKLMDKMVKDKVHFPDYQKLADFAVKYGTHYKPSQDNLTKPLKDITPPQSGLANDDPYGKFNVPIFERVQNSNSPLSYIPDPWATTFRIKATKREADNQSVGGINNIANYKISESFPVSSTPNWPDIVKPWVLAVKSIEVNKIRGGTTNGSGIINADKGTNLISIPVPPGADLEFSISFYNNKGTLASRIFRIIHASKFPNNLAKWFYWIQDDDKGKGIKGADYFNQNDKFNPNRNLDKRLAHPDYQLYYYFHAPITFPGIWADSLDLYGESTVVVEDTNRKDGQGSESRTDRLFGYLDKQEMAAKFLTVVDDEGVKVSAENFLTLLNDVGTKVSVANYLESNEGQNTKNLRLVPKNVHPSVTAPLLLPDTRRRSLNLQLQITNKFSPYLGLELSETKKTEKKYHIDVPSSKAPSPPKISYVSALFSWNHGPWATRNTSKWSIRTGTTIRVYLECPWYSSGDGEQLAVVLEAQQDSSKDKKDLTLFVSSWGSDSIDSVDSKVELQVLSSAISSAPVLDVNGVDPKRFTIDHPLFKPARQWEASITNDNPNTVNFPVIQAKPLNPSQLFNVIPYDVKFDSDKKLWYADITFSYPDDRYTPFIRLALARYQPHSVSYEELSSVSLCDFVQIWPERRIDIDEYESKITLTAKTQGSRSHFYIAVIDRIPTESGTTLLEDGSKPKGSYIYESIWNKPVTFQKFLNWDKATGVATLSIGEPLGGNKQVIVCEFERYTKDKEPPMEAQYNPLDDPAMRLVYADMTYFDSSSTSGPK